MDTKDKIANKMLLLSKSVYITWHFILAYLIAAIALLKEIFISHKQPTQLEKPTGRICIITGGGRGIGFEVVKELSKMDMTVIIAGRETTEFSKLMKDEPELAKKDIRFMTLNLSSIESVRSFVKEFHALKLPLHLLINNAGVMFINERRTMEGYEHHWCINYLSHALLTHLLLPLLVSSGTPEFPSRIVNLSSAVHYVGTINFEDLHFETCYSAEAAYAQSKLALVMFTKTLSEKLLNEKAQVLVNCLHPGVVCSQLFENVLWTKFLPWLPKILFKTTKQGSDTVVHVALSKSVTRGGDYYENCDITSPASAALDKQHRDLLWGLTCEQLNIQKFII